MRIVITRNGTKFIEDLSPTASIEYNSDSDISKRNNIKKPKFFPKTRSVNQIGILSKNLKFNHKSSINIFKNGTKNININDMLKNIINKKNLGNFNIKNGSSLEIIKLKNKNKKVKLPQILENKYILYDIDNSSDQQSNIIPDILLSINNSIDNDYLNKSKSSMKRTKTINDMDNSKQKDDYKNIMTINNEKKIILPKIRKAFPLKYIISKDSYNRLNKEMNTLEKDSTNEKKLFPNNNNYLIKNNWEILKKNVDLSLNNKINAKNVNLIEYLNKDKNISNIYLQQFYMFDKDKINKLEAISKKILFKKRIEEQFNQNIKNKLKTNLEDLNSQFKQSLNNINDKLNECEGIIKKDEDKFVPNDKNRYLDQFIDAEKNWEKYNLERYYKKSSSPKRSAFRSLLA
jgi:hypothetical protein